ncbi:MAG: SpoIIE family protein phosphatase [Actinomycetota bacterium]|nr:SpoIIE family protein phosphatase [Actinomycetota bacterium]
MVSLLVATTTLLLTLVAIGSRPDGTDWAVWRPATGVAVGVAGWYAQHDAWRITVATGIGTGLGATIAGRPLPLCIGAAVVAALEAWLGSRVLRGRTNQVPSISSSAALRRLLLAAGVVGLVTSVGLSVTAAVAFGPDHVIPALLTTTSTHMAGMLLVAPLFFKSPPASRRISRAELLTQWTVLASIVALTFRFTVGLPIAFLVLPPMVWGASRLPYRQFTIQLFLASLAISRLTANSFGPFGAAGISTTTRTLLAGSFSLTIGVLVFTIIASSAQARRVRAALDAREAIYRQSVEASVMGVGALTEVDGTLRLSDLNPTGRDILHLAPAQDMAVVDVFTVDDARSLGRAVANLAAEPSVPWSKEHLEMQSGQILEASLFALAGSADSRAALQFIDVTARQRLLDDDAIERRRAVDIQAALVPGARLVFSGFQIAGHSVASRAIGGDFYDWYAIDGGFAVTLGDVMGKGTGPSMVAAALRTSLRLESGFRSPAAALARVARVIEDELDSVSTFATVFAAHVTNGGRVRYASAGHGLALLCHSDGSQTQLDSRGLPVGVMAGSRWTNNSAQLEPDDTLVVFSDGVLDLFSGGLVPLDEIGQMSGAAPSSDALLERIFSLVDPDSLDDDVTVIAIRRSPGGPGTED